MPPYLEPEEETSLAGGMSDDDEEELLRLEAKYPDGAN
jgi:hypothetical protein